MKKLLLSFLFALTLATPCAAQLVGVVGGEGGKGCIEPANPTLSYTTNLKVWLKPNSFMSCTDDGTSVATWSDSSGLGNDFTQTTEANKPTFRKNQLNGQGCVDFVDANNDVLTSTFALDDTVKTTIFAVVKTNANTGINTLLASSNDTFFLAYQSANNIRSWTNGSGNFDDQAVGDYSIAKYWTFTINETTGTASTTNYRENGVSQGDSASRSRGDSDSLRLGDRAGQGFDGCIMEVLIYAEAVTGTNLTTVENYLKDKYNL